MSDFSIVPLEATGLIAKGDTWQYISKKKQELKSYFIRAQTYDARKEAMILKC